MVTTHHDLTGFYADSVVSGLVVTQDALLTGSISEGVAYIGQVRAVIPAVVGHVFTASKDTYIDVNAAGTYTYVETVIDAGAPALTANSIRIAKVVTNATTIVSITDLRTLHVDDNAFVFGTLTMTGTSMEIYNPNETTVMIRHGSASTANGMPLREGETRIVTETVYARPIAGRGALLITQ